MPDGDFHRRDLSRQQQEARGAILKWLRSSDRQVFQLDGPAGSGKTELIVRLRYELSEMIQYLAFTGKGASVLCARGADNARTGHSVAYGAPIVKDGELIWRRRDDKPCASLIVADECSMIDGKLGRDLLRFGTKLLVTGDGYQLPPVSGTAFFDAPDFRLTQIHRQAAGSQPLKLATAIRGGERVEPVPFDINAVVGADVVICALNRTRRNLNTRIRRCLGIKDRKPVVGDRIVCLRNNYASGVFNGTLWTIVAIERVPANDLLLRMTVVDDIRNEVTTVAHSDGFLASKVNLTDPEYDDLDLFDFGYALTAHKAQGSEWHRVVVIDETSSPGFRFIAASTPLSLSEFTRRWLYTAVTRARSHVALMGAPR